MQHPHAIDNQVLWINVMITYSIVNAGLNAARMIPIMEALKKNTHLQYLNLNNNSGGTESAKALADALGTNKSLTEVFLNGNNVWDEGGSALLAAVENSQSIQMLDLEGNKVDKAILKKIAAAADNNL